MERLFNVLKDLAIDPFQQEAFAQDPAGAMAKLGLSSEERAMLSESKSSQSRAAGGAWTRCACLIDPGPDPEPDPDPPALA